MDRKIKGVKKNANLFPKKKGTRNERSGTKGGVVGEAVKWIEKAEKDLSDARFNLEGRRYEVASFLAHQAAEKALKALYIQKFLRLWKIHDLVALFIEVEGNENLLEVCDELNRHYIETRYPTETKYTERIARRAVGNARRVIEWVMKKMK